MLSSGLHTGLLQTQNCLISRFPGKEGICAKAFPVPSSLGDTSHVHHWPEGDVDTFALVLHTHKESTGTDELTIPSERKKLNSATKERPNCTTYVVAALIPVGKAVTKSAKRTPRGESYTVSLDEKRQRFAVRTQIPLDIIRASFEQGVCCPNVIMLGEVTKCIKSGNPYNTKSIRPTDAGSHINFLFQSETGDLQGRCVSAKS